MNYLPMLKEMCNTILLKKMMLFLLRYTFHLDVHKLPTELENLLILYVHTKLSYHHVLHIVP